MHQLRTERCTGLHGTVWNCIDQHDASLEMLCGEKKTRHSPDIGIVRRGGEGGVKGLDREAAAQPPLTPPAPRLCSVIRGMSVVFSQTHNSIFIKAKKWLFPSMPKNTFHYSLFLSTPFYSLYSKC